MKQTSNLFWRAALGLVLLAAAPACQVLDQEVPTALTPEDTFSTPDRIALASLGMYDALQNPEFLGGRALIYSDFRSDDVDPPTNYFGSITTFNATADNTIAATAWTGGYRTIYGANYFLQNLLAHPGVASSTLESQYIGEAKFIRALAMFHLVNLFAQPYNYTADASHLGIPIQLTAPNAAQAFETAQQLPRATVKEVYDQMEVDLKDAIDKLPEAGSTSFNTVARATKDAARGLLSRVYLYKGDYKQAEQLAGAVISGGRHTLNPDPATPFRSATWETSESIFSVAMTQSDNPNTNNALGQHYNNSRYDIDIDPYVSIPTTLFPATDKRRTNLTTTITARGHSYTTKYIATSGDYVPIVRYPEMLLTRAEALVRSSNSVSADAVALLNQVRDRSKPATTPSYTLANFATGTQSFIDAILLERRLELAFEGHRLYDLLRNKQGVPARGPAAAQAYGSNFLVFPIPLVDVQQNPNLVQNPGY